MRSLLTRCFLCTGVLASAGLVAGCAPQAPDDDAELRRALDVAYPDGWRYATLRTDLISEMGPGDSPAWIRGDFDGDQDLDFAAQVVTYRPGHTLAVDSAQVLLAFLRGGGGLVRHVIDVGGGPHEGIFLNRLSAGDTIQSYDGGPMVVLPWDAVHEVFPNQASVAFVYDRGRWTEIFLGD